MKKELLFENASLQYEGRARLSCLASDQRSSGRLASPRAPQVQAFGFNAAIVVAVSTFVVLYILYRIKPEWFKPFDRYTPEDDFNDIDL
jgi:hypothetical protein